MGSAACSARSGDTATVGVGGISVAVSAAVVGAISSTGTSVAAAFSGEGRIGCAAGAATLGAGSSPASQLGCSCQKYQPSSTSNPIIAMKATSAGKREPRGAWCGDGRTSSMSVGSSSSSGGGACSWARRGSTGWRWRAWCERNIHSASPRSTSSTGIAAM